MIFEGAIELLIHQSIKVTATAVDSKGLRHELAGLPAFPIIPAVYQLQLALQKFEHFMLLFKNGGTLAFLLIGMNTKM